MERSFSFLSAEALCALGLLGNPIYIYCFETRRVCWANAHALDVWNAVSLSELLGRELTPFSAATEVRLDEYRHAFRNGEDRVEGWTLYPKGIATTMLCRMSGVSIEGHAEAMLVEVRALLQSELAPTDLRALEALRHTPLMISLFSQSGAVLMRNPAAAARFGDLDRAQPAGADHFRAMFASQADYYALADQPRDGAPVRRDVVMALPGGPVHTLTTSIVSDPVTGDTARLVAQEDITAFVEVNRQLAASEDALEAVLAINVAPIIILSASNNVILKANLAARTRLGAHLVPGESAERLFIQPEDCAVLRETVLAGQGAATQARLKSAEGDAFWASLRGIRISFEKQDAMAILLIDIDTLYRTAEDLETALSVERTTAAMQRRFLAIASHEFRTPLAMIDSVAQRLARSADTMSPDQVRGRAQRIRQTVARLLQLMENIIERARDNRSALGYVAEEADLAEVIGKTVAEFRDNHPATAVSVHLPPLPRLRIDPTLMAQAFVNLLTNAEKYSDGTARIEISGLVTSEDVQILVRDWGIGIPEKERGRIFSDYVRGSNVGSRPGTGLGLSIVNQIVSLHGGIIEVASSDGPGTTMKITLPRP